MTIDEFVKKYDRFIKLIADVDESADQVISFLIDKAWKSGYEFRIQEEELNKGASY
jgi:hypothetical protein